MIHCTDFKREYIPPFRLLVKTSRGEVVDEKVLYEALKNGSLGGTTLDVMEQEPFDLSSPLLALDNVIFTPHLAAFSADFEKNFWNCSVNKIFASGQAILDAEHRGITPDLTRPASEPDAKIEETKDIKPTRRVGVLNPIE
jgi:hypothetical protein